MKAGTLLAVVTMLALAVPAWAPGAATTTSGTTTVPISETVQGCAQEAVVIEGTLTISFHVTVDDNESVHAFTQARTDGTGVGTVSGVTYQVIGVSNSESNGTKAADGAIEFTTVAYSSVVGPGPVNDQQLLIVVHTTIAATGEITSTVVQSFFDCPDQPPKS